MKSIFKTMLLALPITGMGIATFPTAKAAESEGFVFTEEEVAADAEAHRKLQSLISNGAEYSRACAKAYSDIHLIVGNCYRALGRLVDFQECADQRTVADIHKEAASTLMSRYAIDPASGKFVDGVLCRSNLLKAKPNLTADSYTVIDQNIEQLEAMLKWFMGDFAKTCAYFNSDYYKELQKIARFKELTQTSEYRNMERNYSLLFRDLARGDSHNRIMNSRNDFRRFPEKFRARFDYPIVRQEVEEWYNEVVLDAPDGKTWQYLRVRDEDIVWAPTPQGAELANYETRFDFWTNDRIDAMVELGKNGINAVLDSGTDFNNYNAMAERYPHSLLTQTLTYYTDKTKKQLFNLANELYTFRSFLETKTRYTLMLTERNGKPIKYWAKRKLDFAKNQWKEILKQAQEDLPEFRKN